MLTIIILAPLALIILGAVAAHVVASRSRGTGQPR